MENTNTQRSPEIRGGANIPGQGGAAEAPAVGRLEVKDLSKVHGETTVIRRLSIEILPGEFFTVLGPSGSGKTTLLLMIAGFVKPTGGRLFLDGEDVAPLPPHRRAMGIVFQNLGLFPHLSVAGNVMFPLRMHGVSRTESRKRAEAMLDRVGLSAFSERRPHTLSGGEQQRVALARVLVHPPKVLLMDEPLGSLDPPLREELQKEIKRIHREYRLTVCYVTHNRDEALHLSDRIAVLHAGEAVQVGAPADLYYRPNTAYVAKSLGEVNFIPATVTDRGGDTASLELPGGQSAAVPGDAVPKEGGRRFLAVVRPEQVLIQSAEDAPEGDKLGWRGRMEEIAFYGGHKRVFVRTEGGLRIVASCHARTSLPADSSVWVGFASSAVHLIPKNPE